MLNKEERYMKKILVVEDSLDLQVLLKMVLGSVYRVEYAQTLAGAREAINHSEFDLVLLDLTLPDGDGVDLCLDLKDDHGLSRVPIVILTGNSEIEERVRGLNAGADDFVIKPFHSKELLARIESVLRRGPARHMDSAITLDDVTVDLSRQQAWHHKNSQKKLLDLTPIEFRILLTLFRYNGFAVSRQTLVGDVWDQSVHLSERNVDTHVCKLRKKLSETHLNIANRRNEGYFIQIQDHEIEQLVQNRVLEFPILMEGQCQVQRFL